MKKHNIRLEEDTTIPHADLVEFILSDYSDESTLKLKDIRNSQAIFKSNISYPINTKRKLYYEVTCSVPLNHEIFTIPDMSFSFVSKRKVIKYLVFHQLCIRDNHGKIKYTL